MFSSETSCIFFFFFVALFTWNISVGTLVILSMHFFIHWGVFKSRKQSFDIWKLKPSPFFTWWKTHIFSIFKLSFNVYIKISPVFTPLKCIISLLWWTESILVGENKLSLQVLVSRKSVRMLSDDDRYSQRIGWRWPTDTHNWRIGWNCVNLEWVLIDAY